MFESCMYQGTNVEKEGDELMAAMTAAVAALSLKSNNDQQGQQFCGQENADATASETHPPPYAPLPENEDPVLPPTKVDDQLRIIYKSVRKEPSFEADRDAADAGQQQPSIQGATGIQKFGICPHFMFFPSELSPLPPCSSTPPPPRNDESEEEWAQIGDRVPPTIGVAHSKICQLLDEAAGVSSSAVVMLPPKIFVTPPDGEDCPTPECFSETASTITEKVRMLKVIEIMAAY